eukprot:NODE_9620_length_576_cov_18.509934_g8983_i0.p1 GENE.NODE_9620_length_576_cov_18.509934_g8983_i0~~NODE_9620_length_576_cov_18.509934_g8983_i0.p1  ORF type:complete len:158 (-),score=21.76 NODE_9620_length_576_cov_18.509934_g8983_i0:49-522(-)
MEDDENGNEKAKTIGNLLSRFHSQDPTRYMICDGLYVGSLNSIKSLLRDKDASIQAILSIGVSISIPNDSSIHHKYIECFDFINQHIHEGIIVHCMEGKSRSITIVAAYLMFSNHWSLSFTMEHIQNIHPKAKPNLGFMAALLTLQKSLISDGITLR